MPSRAGAVIHLSFAQPTAPLHARTGAGWGHGMGGRQWIGPALAAALALAAPAGAQPSIAVEDAVLFCEGGLRPEAGASERATREQRGFCIALIDGVVGTVAQIAALASGNARGDGTPIRAVFCLPTGTGYPQLAETFVAFARANPQHQRRVAAAIMVAAFAARYPCG